MLLALRTTRESGVAVLLRGAAVTLVLGLLAAVVGGLTVGAPAAWGAVCGTALVVLVAAGGALVVNAVAGVLPSASMLVALLTYTLQLLLVLLALLGLERSGLLETTLDRTWVGGAVIGGVLVWLGTQVALATGTRIPAYDLTSDDPSASPSGSPSGATPEGPKGGDRP
ncbi:hypothetical protein [Nocardioides coralli]|uniref:hypothetical protein n=1 Tax=Nocardioides coralli TaxID=2872154 RepID=UPI001CA3C637|nr:hypothetical protein [Nocardioides coralli]QZY30189.1 hypothetical protein K6T13_05795 [Nocardioides coralli]